MRNTETRALAILRCVGIYAECAATRIPSLTWEVACPLPGRDPRLRIACGCTSTAGELAE